MPCWHLYLEARVETGSHIITQAWNLQVGSSMALLLADISISTCVKMDFSSFTLTYLWYTVSDTGTKGCLEKSLGSFFLSGVFLFLSPHTTLLKTQEGLR